MASSYGGKSSCLQVNLCSGLKNWEIRMHSSGCKIIMHSNGLFIRKARMAVVMWNSCYSVDYLIEFEIVLVQHEWLVYKTENETFFFFKLFFYFFVLLYLVDGKYLSIWFLIWPHFYFILILINLFRSWKKLLWRFVPRTTPKNQCEKLHDHFCPYAEVGLTPHCKAYMPVLNANCRLLSN